MIHLITKPFARLRAKGQTSVVPPLFIIHSMMRSPPDLYPGFAVSGSPVPVYSLAPVFFGKFAKRLHVCQPGEAFSLLHSFSVR